jgi:flagellar motor switch protein FliG
MLPLKLIVLETVGGPSLFKFILAHRKLCSKPANPMKRADEVEEELLKQILGKLESIETKLDRLEKKQESYDRILSVLSLRSIEQESYLKRN